MNVTVRTFGSLRELAERQFEVEIRDGASVAGLLSFSGALILRYLKAMSSPSSPRQRAVRENT